MNGVQTVSNFLIPAAGSPRAQTISETLVAGAPIVVDFRNTEIDGLPFRPYGFFADNTQGAQPLTISIVDVGFTYTVPAGAAAMMPYPATPNTDIKIEGAGFVTVVFVDFPVTPWATQTAPTIAQAPGYDTDGDPLPPQFDTAPRTFGYDGSGNMDLITVTVGADSWEMTLGYDGSNNLISQSGWVKQ